MFGWTANATDFVQQHSLHKVPGLVFSTRTSLPSCDHHRINLSIRPNEALRIEGNGWDQTALQGDFPVEVLELLAPVT
jgi:hypothetical protein